MNHENVGQHVAGRGLRGADCAALVKHFGERIDGARFEDDKLKLRFGDKTVTVWDSGQSCCESRWMTTDDDVSGMVGEVLRDGEIADGPEPSEEDAKGYDVYDSQFFRLMTDKATYTFVTHVDHNGYYGGFSLEASED